MKITDSQICPPFRVGCNVYRIETFLQGFADAIDFIRSCCSEDDATSLTRYLRKHRTMATNHFADDCEYPGAAILGMIPDKKFVTIDAWVTRLVKTADDGSRVAVEDVSIDSAQMILCQDGFCISRAEARGTDPFVMSPFDLEKQMAFYRLERDNGRQENVV